jgi:protein-disulfide isomerase
VISQEKSLKLVIIQMPILGKKSDELSKLALASSLQGKFNEVHNYLYSAKRKSRMEDIYADLFLMDVDLTQLDKDLESEAVIKLISQHINIVNDFKFTGTPAIIIGNTIIPGFIKADKISEILEKEFF